MLVADGDGEAAVVGADHLDGRVGVAGDVQLVVLALVRRLVLRAIGALAWKKKRKRFEIGDADGLAILDLEFIV